MTNAKRDSNFVSTIIGVSSVDGVTPTPVKVNPSTGALLSEINEIRAAGQLWLSAAGMWPSTTSGCATNAKDEESTNKQNYYTLSFDADAVEYSECSLAMPSDWDASTITAKFYWRHADTTTNFKVAWSLQGVSMADDQVMDATWGTAVQANDIGGTTGDLYISPATAAITIAGATASELVQFRVSRVATDATNDTLAIDAKLIGVMISYTRV